MIVQPNELINMAASLIGADDNGHDEYDRGVADMVKNLMGTDTLDIYSSDIVNGLRSIAQTYDNGGVGASRGALDLMIRAYFPDALAVFYQESDNELAAVESADGNMWRVWADGSTEIYTR